ncbi:MAG TPA: hypothetical protein VMS31_19235, partial [Pyrinomonadaceae bacterium]|nr:hypothetical protein [Pyrinomonadaceae bacterium]
ADSRTLVALQEETAKNLWVSLDGDPKSAQAITPLRRNVRDQGAVWTPDGSILVGSNAGGDNRAWLMKADGSGQKALTDIGEFDGGLKVSPDGRFIFFFSMRSKTRQIWRKDIDGSNPKQLTDAGGVDSFSLTPDGASVIYALYTPGIWKISVDGGTPTKLSDVVAFGLDLSPDGKFVAFVSPDDKMKRLRLVVETFDKFEPVSTFDLPVTAENGHWAPDGRAFVYVETLGSISNLWRLPLDGSPARQISDFKSEYIPSFSYSGDGSKLVLSRGSTNRDAVLITDEK